MASRGLEGAGIPACPGGSTCRIGRPALAFAAQTRTGRDGRKAGTRIVRRDARAGRFHPANSSLTHELLAKMTLGIDPDEQPRWG